MRFNNDKDRFFQTVKGNVPTSGVPFSNAGKAVSFTSDAKPWTQSQPNGVGRKARVVKPR